GHRASELTRQLLAFSRKQVLKPISLDVNCLILETQKLLERTIGEHFQLSNNLAPDLKAVLADQGQISQIIINLAVNARDAMPRGGTLSITTANDFIPEPEALKTGLSIHGEVVKLTVADTGSGMTEAVRARIFEPFFTTKDTGSGTGMGLAMVYGIVKQTGGDITVWSAPGQGTRVTIFFPASSATRLTPAESPEVFTGSLAKNETILIVEDEAPLRSLLRAALEKQGYNILTAPDGSTALSIAHEFPGTINLILSDMVMPGLSGVETAIALLETRPHIHICFMSGYVQESLHHPALDLRPTHFIQKPFHAREIIAKIQGILNQS
ncbi:response regulator, partial [Myxococcota bacterium]|nr:response regulator [Myxococcota bacterium]